MASSRHASRLAVVQTLFAWEFRGGDAEETLMYVLEQFYDDIASREFALSNLQGTLKNSKRIEEIVVETAPEWPFEKIAPIDRVILEQGVYEIVFSKDVPPVVAINEAIEVAKAFGNEKSSKFINGVLSTVMKKYNPKKDDKS